MPLIPMRLTDVCGFLTRRNSNRSKYLVQLDRAVGCVTPVSDSDRQDSRSHGSQD